MRLILSAALLSITAIHVAAQARIRPPNLVLRIPGRVVVPNPLAP